MITRKITDYSNKNSFGSKLRTKRIGPLLSMINEVYEKRGRVDILDLGGTREYWGIIPKSFLEEKKVHISILNLPDMNKPIDEAGYSFLEGDACDLVEMRDQSFDIVHSNSVVEHVGDWHKMLKFSKEVKRLGKNYYIQTPYYWFPIEPHCMTPLFHWLPKPIRVSLVMKFSLGHWGKQSTVSDAMYAVDSARLLDKKMFKALFLESSMITEKLFLLPKSLIAVHVEKS